MCWIAGYISKDKNFFNENEMVFYKNVGDLSEKIIKISRDDKLRKKIAQNGKKKYFKLFNEKRITKHMIDISLGKLSSLF